MNLCVLLGGFSAERDVSLASGLRMAEALRTKGHAVTCVDPASGPLTAAQEQALLAGGVGTRPPSREQLQALASRERDPGAERAQGIDPAIATWPAVRGADVVVLALHGGQGEDGSLQALLDMAGIRYTGSGHLASAIAMDKQLSKILFRAAGVRTADWLMAPAPDAPEADGFAERVVSTLGLPVVVKPSKQGSSVALTVVKRVEQLAPAIAEAFVYDDEVLVEAFVPGRELTVGLLGPDEALPVFEIKPKNEIYDYECKYTAGMAEEGVAELPDALAAEIREQARLAYRALKLGGCARVDFRLTEAGEAYCLEANTLPGMTGLSLVPQAAAAAGLLFPDLCERIVGLARRGG